MHLTLLRCIQIRFFWKINKTSSTLTKFFIIFIIITIIIATSPFCITTSSENTSSVVSDPIGCCWYCDWSGEDNMVVNFYFRWCFTRYIYDQFWINLKVVLLFLVFYQINRKTFRCSPFFALTTWRDRDVFY